MMFSRMGVGVTDSTAQARPGGRVDDQGREARRVLDAVADGVLVVRSDGTILDINLAAERLFGMRAEEAAGRGVSSLLPALGERSTMAKLFERSVALGGIDADVPAQTSPDVPVHITISQFLERDDTRYVLVVRDFRPIRLAQARRLETERLAAIGETMTALAHESRNALQRMQSCLTLLKVRTAEDVHELVDDMQEAQDQLQRLYEEVRSFAAPYQLKLQLTDVRQLLEKTWRQLRMQWADKQLVFSPGRAAEDLGTTKARVDQARLAQVFRNVLENAIQASPSGGCVRVEVTAAGAGPASRLHVSIEDQGPGIPVLNRERVFDLLYTTKPGGTGMGLALAKRIVREHDGKIVAAGSPELGGARIEITLPRTSRLDA